jgi:hypothetical protein
MTMIKVNPPRAFPQLDGLPQLEQVKVAADGLRGNDLSTFIKSAGHSLAQWVRDNPPAPGEVYVHSRAMGAGEFVGSNRNGDHYSLEMLRRDVPTFEKNAWWFIDHQNRDPKKSYGKVKKAYLNEDTGMVDTITALNATKEAAERNGNLVAERTLQKLASGIDVAVSQSCSVPGDRCMACGNWAKTRAQYCGPQTCKYGGCRDNLGRVFDDGFHLAVDNPHCNFFDLSDVSNTRGADRTAFITGKVAAARCVGGAELAEQLGLVPPDFLVDPAVRSASAMAKKLATAHVEPVGTDWSVVLQTRGPAPDLTGSDVEVHQKIAALAAGGVVLPPDIWLSAVTGAPVEKCAAVFAGGLDVRRDLLARDDLTDLLSDYTVSATGVRHSLAPTVQSLVKEAQLAVLHEQKAVVKCAGVDEIPPAIRAEAKGRYLAYQCGILAAHENFSALPLILSDCLRHNRSYNA